jgi:hypothetical protein
VVIVWRYSSSVSGYVSAGQQGGATTTLSNLFAAVGRLGWVLALAARALAGRAQLDSARSVSECRRSHALLSDIRPAVTLDGTPVDVRSGGERAALEVLSLAWQRARRRSGAGIGGASMWSWWSRISGGQALGTHTASLSLAMAMPRPLTAPRPGQRHFLDGRIPSERSTTVTAETAEAIALFPGRDSKPPSLQQTRGYSLLRCSR